MVQVARCFIDFDAGVSCGKCVPCRVGSVELGKILDRIILGRGTPEDLPQMDLICHAMQEAPYCDFARASSGTIMSILRHFRSEFEAHMAEGGCFTRSCREIGLRGP